MSATDGSIGISRKRRKMSPEDTSAPISKMDIPEHNASASASASADDVVVDDVKEKNPCPHEETLRTLNTDIDSMRQLITCNICQRFMYEPYALSCGHTYCYSCLAEWMGTNHKKTCPDCRTFVKQEPTSAFLIRKMVQIFTNRTQLLPDGETSEEHHQLAREEADIVTKDRDDTDERQGGLFKGTFSRPAGRKITGVYDATDHVVRCPNCLYEVEDGWCLTCHVRIYTGADSDESIPSPDDAEGPREFHGPWDVEGPTIYGDTPEEEDSEEDEDEHDLTGFVEEEVRWEDDADVPDYSFEEVDFDETPYARGAAPVSDVSDSEDASDEAESVQPARRRLVNRRSALSSARAAITVSSDDSGSDSDSDEEGPVRHQRRRTNRYIDGNEEDEDSSSAGPSEDGSAGDQPTTSGFSPLQYDSDDTTRPADGDVSPTPEPTSFDVRVDTVTSSGESSSSSDDESMHDQFDERSDDDDGSGELEGSGSDEDSDGSENIPIEPRSHHRLETLVQRHNRFIDPSPSLGSRSGTSAEEVSGRLALASRSLHRNTQAPQTYAPAHPFNLESTLARIAAADRHNGRRITTDSNRR